MLGMYDEAKAEFARVLEQDQANDVARRNLTYLSDLSSVTRRLLPALPLLSLPCLLLWPAVFGGQAFVPADLLRDVAPWRTAGRSAPGPLDASDVGQRGRVLPLACCSPPKRSAPATCPSGTHTSSAGRPSSPTPSRRSFTRPT